MNLSLNQSNKVRGSQFMLVFHCDLLNVDLMKDELKHMTLLDIKKQPIVKHYGQIFLQQQVIKYFVYLFPSGNIIVYITRSIMKFTKHLKF